MGASSRKDCSGPSPEDPGRIYRAIGSSQKRDAIFRALLKRGFRPSDLDRVHSFIGLSIGAETPEEIAVSIVAEIIQYCAGNT